MENKNTFEVIEYIKTAVRNRADKSEIINGVVKMCGGSRDAARNRINAVVKKMQADGENIVVPVASRNSAKAAPAAPAPVSTNAPAPAPVVVTAPANPANATYPVSHGSNGELIYSRVEPILAKKGEVDEDFVLSCLGLMKPNRPSAFALDKIYYNSWDGMAPGGATVPCGQVKIAVRRKASEDGLTLEEVDKFIESRNLQPRPQKLTTYTKVVTVRDRKTKKRVPDAQVTVYDKDGTAFKTYKTDKNGDFVVEYSSLMNGLYAKVDSVPKGYNKPGKIDIDDVGYVVQINLADIHVGLLAWVQETGASYDLKICKSILLGCITQICERLRAMNVTIKKIILVTLGDLLHIDTEQQTTTHGTFQQVEGRFPKIYDTAVELMEEVIDLLLSVAPVQYMYVSGNHDRITGYAVARTLERSFKNENNIEFDISANPIKYFTVGQSAIVVHHGDMSQKNLEKLPFSVIEDHTGLRSYYVHVGHLHSSSMAISANGKVTVEHFDSICLASAWEHQQGYPESPIVSVYALIWDGTAAPPMRVVGSYDPN